MRGPAITRGRECARIEYHEDVESETLEHHTMAERKRKAGTASRAHRKRDPELRDNYGQMLADFLELQVRGAAHAELTLAALKSSVLEHEAPHPEALDAGLGVLRSADLTPVLGHIRQPVLVVSGQYDRVTSPHAAQALASALPSAHAVVIRRAAHAPFLSHPDEFLGHVLPFIETSAAA